MKTKVKAVIFDVDNTIIDFMKFKEISIETSISAMIDSGLNKSRKEIWEVIDRIYREKGIEYQHIFDDALKKLMGKIDYKILAAGIVAYRKAKAGHIDPYPNVIPTLIELIKRGYKLGVISDAPRLQMYTRLCDMKLQHFFDFIASAEDVGAAKPSRLPFEHALSLLKLDPEQVMMVGDKFEKDVIGAKNMGMVAVLAQYGKVDKMVIGMELKEVKNKDIRPDYEIRDIKDILKILP